MEMLDLSELTAPATEARKPPRIADFQEKLEFLFQRHRYKVLWGGRGGMKSWGIAGTLLIEGSRRELRILCCREFQSSNPESVHQLLAEQIKRLGLSSRYVVQKDTIVGTNGTKFIFAGLRHNVRNIKSLESADIVWVEEADQVSKDSWETLIPTIRKPGSEIWISFNPQLETDETYKRFVLNPPPDAEVVQTSYLDNPWLPEELRVEAEYLKRTDPKTYSHVWGGECKSAIEGAIYAEELKKAQEEDRICFVPPDRMRPVDTFWDLGFGDKTAIWFVQSYGGGYNFIDYLENSGKTIEWYVIQLQNRGYVYGQDWLPHDAVDAIIHQKLAGDKTRSIEMLMRAAGRKVRMAPKLLVTDGINAARTLFSQCRFDATKCADGIQSLRHYQWAPIAALEAQAPEGRIAPAGRKPLHNFASHGADAFRTCAVSIRQPDKPATHEHPAPTHYTEHSWMG